MRGSYERAARVRIEDGAETFWVVAAAEDDARAVMSENGMLEDESDPAVCDCERAQFEQMPDDNVLAVRDEDADPIARVVKTCEQWASDGRGYFAGTVWGCSGGRRAVGRGPATASACGGRGLSLSTSSRRGSTRC